jgi:hypothetical protein
VTDTHFAKCLWQQPDRLRDEDLHRAAGSPSQPLQAPAFAEDWEASNIPRIDAAQGREEIERFRQTTTQVISSAGASHLYLAACG